MAIVERLCCPLVFNWYYISRFFFQNIFNHHDAGDEECTSVFNGCTSSQSNLCYIITKGPEMIGKLLVEKGVRKFIKYNFVILHLGHVVNMTLPLFREILLQIC